MFALRNQILEIMFVMEDSKVYIGKEDNVIEKKMKRVLWIDQSDRIGQHDPCTTSEILFCIILLSHNWISCGIKNLVANYHSSEPVKGTGMEMGLWQRSLFRCTFPHDIYETD